MQKTNLSIQLADQIREFIRAEDAPKGARLIERKLAEHLRVSRSPVRSALQLLAEEGIVGVHESGGYVVLAPRKARPRAPSASSGEDDIYYRIAADRLEGRIPDRITENELLRRYEITRPQLISLLRRISGEGWIERLPGHGWAFSPMLTSNDTYEDSYRFRLLIEPAAILEPRFELDRASLEDCRVQQQRLADGDIWRVSSARLFDLNSGFHETIMACSRNTFFIDGLRRINKVRRLIEYRQRLNRERAIVRCREHVELIDLLLAGKREEASAFLHRHLASVGPEKVASRTE